MQSRRAERIVYCYYVDDFVHVFLCGLFNAIILSFLVDPAFFENVKSLFGAGGSVSFYRFPNTNQERGCSTFKCT